jgi:hypothetical protein
MSKIKTLFLSELWPNMPNGKGSVTPVRMEHHRRGNYPKQEKSSLEK